MATRGGQLGDVTVAFDDAGSGPAIVLLPPFPFDRRVYAANARALLASGQRVIALDYPGFGQSPPLAATPTGAALAMTALAEQVRALMDRLEVASATLLGLSMGGYVALAFAARFPRYLRALVLADTRAAADGPAARDGRATALRTIDAQGVDAYLTQSLPRLLAPDARAELLAAVHGLAERRATTLRAGIAALRDRPDRTGELGHIACPTLVLCGAVDQVSPTAEMRGIAAAIAGSRFVELAGAGHLSNLEAPAAFDAALGDFLRSLPPEGPSS